MKNLTLLLITVITAGLLFYSPALWAASPKPATPAKKTPTKTPKPNLAKMLKIYAPVKITADLKILTPKEKKALKKMLAAAALMDQIFWKQSYHGNLALKKKLEKSTAPDAKARLKLFLINFGPFDRMNNNKPFIGTSPKPLGAGFYPESLSKKAFEAWIKNHPEDRTAFESHFTVIKNYQGKLMAVPYKVEYLPELAKASKLLKEAAALTDNPSLKKYLASRALALLSDDYFQSDCDWIDLTGNKIDIVIGPYEVYEDSFLGLKASYEAFITIKDPKASQKLDKFISYLPELEKSLPLAAKYKKTKVGLSSPLVVEDEIVTAGDAKKSGQTIAFALPNDEKVRQLKGSKKVMLRNVMRAKCQTILIPIAKKVLTPEQVKNVTFDAFFNNVMLHEIAHALGPDVIKTKKEELTVNQALKECYSGIEEAKADIVGLYCTSQLIKAKVLPQAKEKEYFSTFVASIFRSMRFGTEEAHGKSNLIQFNYLLQKGAFTYEKGKVKLNQAKMEKAVKMLARELLMIEATGDYAQAKKFLAKYGKPGKEVLKALQQLKTIPVDIVPVYKV